MLILLKKAAAAILTKIIMARIDIDEEKKQFEAAGGFENYLKNRRVKTNLLGAILIYAAGFATCALIVFLF